MKIIVAGIYRSGSTWLFNAVRLMAEKRFQTSSSGFIWWDLDPSDCSVIKTHAFYSDKELQFRPTFVVTSSRRKSEIIKSMKKQRRKGVDPRFINAGNFEEINVFFDWLNSWRRHDSHVYEMDYDDLERGYIQKILKELNKALSFGLSETQLILVELELIELKAPAEGFDPVTLLTPTHPNK